MIGAAFLCAAACLCLGCSKAESGSRPGLVKAMGTITYNGEPIADALIEMRPVDETITNCLAVGRTDEKGVFVMMTDRPNDGAMPGKYKTVVKKQVEMFGDVPLMDYLKENNKDGNSEFMYDRGKVVVKDLLPPQYADPEKTPLVVEIPEKGDKEIRLELKD